MVSSNTRAKRNTAWTMLLVWLFALTSGVANACLMQERATHGHMVRTLDPNHSTAVSAGHAGVTAEHGKAAVLSRAPCLKVCDDSRSLRAHQISVEADDPGAAPLIAAAWAVATPVPLASRRLSDRRSFTSLLPLRLRYARLAL